MSNLAYGYWEVSIEKSGRLKLPTALLRALSEEEREVFYVTHGFGEYITLWSERAYMKQMEYMNSLDRNLLRVKLYRNAFLRNTAQQFRKKYSLSTLSSLSTLHSPLSTI